MTSFRIGQRVQTTVDAPAAWPGAPAAPIGTLGTITRDQDQWGTYGVLFDDDPYNLPASYSGDQLAPLDAADHIGPDS